MSGESRAPKAKKRFGQHFLYSPGLIARILDALEATHDDPILEIGPGPGTLTIPLNQRGFSFKVVEVDRDMAAFLREQAWQPPVEVIEDDFLQQDLSTVIQPGTKVLSNLPYNVSVPITAYLLRGYAQIPLMVMMYQKEVAERIRAKPSTKAYGTISICVQCYYTIDLHFNVPPGAFKPPPKVMSQVIRLRALAKPLMAVALLPELERLVSKLFSNRRKMVRTTLRKAGSNWSDAPSLLRSFEICGFDPQARPENLSPQDYARWVTTWKESE